MKKAKFVFLFLVASVSFLLFAACGNRRLGKPMDLHIDEDLLLTWNLVMYADSYVISVDGVESTVDINRYSLTDLEPGTYEIKVKATGNENYSDSDWASIQYVATMQEGLVDVSLTDWVYGDNANNPVFTIKRGNYINPIYTYKIKNADDDTYTSVKPTEAGDYTVKASFDSTAIFIRFSATCDFAIYSYVTKNLRFNLIDNGKAYEVSGIGAAMETDIIVPPSYNSLPVTQIGFQAFSYPVITSIIIPNSVKIISDGAFLGCTTLKIITIPNSVTDIGREVFFNCISLAAITIPGSVKIIGDNPFLGCHLAITVEDRNTCFKMDGNCLIQIDNGMLITGFHDSKIPGYVTYIGGYAFADCTALTSIVIPNGVKSILSGAFLRCVNLKSVTIPNSVTEIHSAAFCECTSLSNITLPNSVISIGSNAFYECIGLMNITIPNKLKVIESGAFRNTNITNIILPSSVAEIHDNPFAGCLSLTLSVANGNKNFKMDGNCLIQIDNAELIAGFSNSVIPDYVKSIGNCAFEKCSGLTSIVIGKNITSIGYNAFFDCKNLTNIVIPNSVKNIGYSMFFNCEKLTSVILPDGIKIIEDQMFCNCTSLTTITIPDSVTSIGYAAFNDCISLENITIPSSVISIDSSFYGCTGLKSITLSNNVKSFEDSSFYFCENLTIYREGYDIPKIWFEVYYSNHPVIFGCTLSNDKTYVVSFTKSESSILIPLSPVYAYPREISAPYRKGYTFLGWAIEDGGDAEYSASEIIYVQNGTTLYAVWLENV